MNDRLPSRRGVRGRVIATVAAAVLGSVAGLAPLAFPASALADAAESRRLLDEANRKVRQMDTAGALAKLEAAIASDPTNVDAHIRFQDLRRATTGVADLVPKYAAAATAAPSDPVAQFLSARLLAPAEAIAAFEKLAGQFRDSPWPPAGRARALEDAGRYTEAAAAHGEAVTRAGAEAARFLAYQAYGRERAAAWGPAVDAWKAVLAKAPSDLSAHLGLAESLRKGGLHEESLAALDAAAKVGASEPEIAYRRALVHVDAENWDKAIDAFEAALQLDRMMIEALCGACDAAVRQARAKAESENRDLTEKDFDRATSYGDRATIVFTDFAYAHFALGACHEAAGWVNPDRYDAALKCYEDALARIPIPGPEKVRVLTAKAYVQIEKEQFDGAIETAQKAIDIDRNDLTAYGHAGFALCALGKPQDAINRFYKPALKVDPKCARILHDMGVALWEMKKPNDAKKPLEDARTAAPDVGRYRFTLGCLYYELKMNKQACAELLEATERLPRDIEAWRAYGKACYSNKSWDECLRAYEKVCELDPKAVDEHLYVAYVYAEQKKDREKAKAHVLKYRENGGSDDNLNDWMNQLLADDKGGN